MIYTIKNDILSVQVNSLGAELWAIRDLRDNADHLWYGDDKFWDRRASTMFPIAGNVKNGVITVDGTEYPMPMHGFFRDEETVVIEQTETMIRLRGVSSEYTKTMYPFNFAFDSVFSVEGDTVHQKVIITNNSEVDMPFSVAFHPGFLCPFDAAHKNTEYKLRFEQKEDLVNLWTRIQPPRLQKPDLFDTDTLEVCEAFCVPIRYYKGLKSRWVQLEEIDSGRAVRMKIDNFPTVVFWAVNSADFPFVCFEPLEGEFDSGVEYVEFKDRPGNLILKSNEKYENTLSISIIQPE